LQFTAITNDTSLHIHATTEVDFVTNPLLSVFVGVITTAGNRNAGQTVRGRETYCLGWSVALVRLRVAAGVNGDPELKGCGSGHGKHNTDFLCIGKNMGFGTLQRLGEVDIVAAYIMFDIRVHFHRYGIGAFGHGEIIVRVHSVDVAGFGVGVCKMDKALLIYGIAVGIAKAVGIAQVSAGNHSANGTTIACAVQRNRAFRDRGAILNGLSVKIQEAKISVGRILQEQ
jgi:hypothetical protein